MLYYRTKLQCCSVQWMDKSPRAAQAKRKTKTEKRNTTQWKPLQQKKKKKQLYKKRKIQYERVDLERQIRELLHEAKVTGKLDKKYLLRLLESSSSPRLHNARATNGRWLSSKYLGWVILCGASPSSTLLLQFLQHVSRNVVASKEFVYFSFSTSRSCSLSSPTRVARYRRQTPF